MKLSHFKACMFINLLSALTLDLIVHITNFVLICTVLYLSLREAQWRFARGECFYKNVKETAAKFMKWQFAIISMSVCV